MMRAPIYVAQGGMILNRTIGVEQDPASARLSLAYFTQAALTPAHPNNTELNALMMESDLNLVRDLIVAIRRAEAFVPADQTAERIAA